MPDPSPRSDIATLNYQSQQRKGHHTIRGLGLSVVAGLCLLSVTGLSGILYFDPRATLPLSDLGFGVLLPASIASVPIWIATLITGFVIALRKARTRRDLMWLAWIFLSLYPIILVCTLAIVGSGLRGMH
jgi:hypothetical protein